MVKKKPPPPPVIPPPSLIIEITLKMRRMKRSHINKERFNQQFRPLHGKTWLFKCWT